MDLDTDQDLLEVVGGPDFVWGPTVCKTGDPAGLDPSEVPDNVPISLPHNSSPHFFGEEIPWLCIRINVPKIKEIT